MTCLTKTSLNRILTFSFVAAMAVATASSAQAGPFWFDDFEDSKGFAGQTSGSPR